jgi:glycosyltransferase involved in cell wall biosynthesis
MSKLKMLTIGIDATNLRIGGGVTHLVELLRAAKPLKHGINRIVVWGNTSTLSRIEDRIWLTKCAPLAMDKNLFQRMLWQLFCLTPAAHNEGCDLLFVPGGSYIGNFHPVVTMSRNLLPFEMRELLRFGWTFSTLKMLMLRLTQSRSYHQVDGLIFLNQYAKESVLKVTGKLSCKTMVIPHGIHSRFNSPPRLQRPIEMYSIQNPFQILYVSTIDVHKHQWHVVDAIAILRREGFPITLSLIGPAYPPALKRLKNSIERLDKNGDFIVYKGEVPHDQLNIEYVASDLCLFASTCENMPNILLEGMASGAPLACSNRGPMPEILKDAGVYFDPERPQDIANAIRKLLLSSDLRAKKSDAAFLLVQQYSWRRCADETLAFLSKIA